jgi:CMP/dCMP kinase
MDVPFTTSKFRNIAISGNAASGATTLSRFLAEKLGWRLINGGEIVREYVKKNGIPLEKTTQTSDGYHRQLDDFIKKKLRDETSLVIESWLAGYDAQGIDGVYKIYVTCPDDAIRIDRLVNREHMTVEEAKNHLLVRETENVKKWEKVYGTRDFWNSKYFDLIIDTYENGPTETLKKALQAIGYQRL